MLANNILDIVTLAIILLIAISLHEYAHAYVSYKLGDPTPKLQWRLTTNPLKHIDPIWFLMIFLIWFGWGKPVQINPYYYNNPVKWELLVALAWPAMNLVLAIIGIFVMLVSAKLTWMWLENIMTWNGFRIVKIISLKFANMIEKYTQYIVIWFLIIVVLWRNPIWQFLWNTSYKIFRLIFTFFSNIFY